MKIRKNGIIIVGIIIIVCVTFYIALFYTDVFGKIMYTWLMFFCTYKVFESICLEKGVKKLTAAEYWLYVLFLNLLIFDIADKTNAFDTMVVTAAIIVFTARCVRNYIKCDNWLEETGYVVAFILVSMLFALAVAEVKSMVLFWAFKVCMLIILLSGIKIISHTSKMWGLMILLGLYAMLIGINGILNAKFLYDSWENGVVNFYISVKNLYSLPDISELRENKEAIEILINYVACRLIDATLVSGMVNTIMGKDIGQEKGCINCCGKKSYLIAKK